MIECRFETICAYVTPAAVGPPPGLKTFQQRFYDDQRTAKGQRVTAFRGMGRVTKRPRGASDLFGTVDFALSRHVSPHGQVTAVSMMKDEGPYVIEWVAHHLAVGFTDLVVYTNDCSDGTDDLLIRLEELGLAHHRRNVIAEGIRPQPSALNHAQDEPVVRQSDWVMVFDADEFLSIRYGDGTLDDLIAAARVQDANGIVVTWRIFGSGGVVDWSRAPVTEQYLMAAPVTWNKGWGVKTLFTFDADYWKLGIHRPKMKNRHIDTIFPDTVKWLNGSGRVMEDYFKFRGWRSITRTVGYDWVQLNHYAVKSVDSYAIRKMRGNVNNKKDKYNSDYWSLQDRNEERDDTMLRYSKKRNEIIKLLLTDPVLHRLHHAAVDRAEVRLAELRATQAYTDLVADLARASVVPINEIVAKPPQARDKEKIASLMSEVEKRLGSKAKADRKASHRDIVETVPFGNYRSGLVQLGGALQGEWTPNHAILLPQDPRLFTEPALQTIAKGKFDRGLARRLPQVLDRDARLLEVGAGVGFLGAHLAAMRPDLTIMLQEDHPSLRHAMNLILKKNNRSLNSLFFLSETLLTDDPVTGLVRLIVETKPDALLLGDARLSVAVLQVALTTQPRQIFLHGRLLDAHKDALPEYERLLINLGYLPGYGFDPNLTRGFGLGHVDLK